MQVYFMPRTSNLVKKEERKDEKDLAIYAKEEVKKFLEVLENISSNTC